MNKYFLKYNWFDKEYAIDIYADSREEAEARVQAIKATLEYEGELAETVNF